jgi:tetratricopeptide (TPR) repeat protein
MKKYGFAIAAAMLLIVSPLASAAPVPAPPSEEKLKEQLLKLNSLTTTETTQTKLVELLKDKSLCKLLVATAVKMQADAPKGEPPFKFNAALLIGKLAHNNKDYKSAETFYKFCQTTATKLESGSQIALAYDALIDLFWEQKKFQAVEDLCQELLESGGTGKEMQAAQSFAIERMIQAKARRGEYDEALRVANNIVAGTKNSWYALQIKGYVLREAGKFDDALDVYKEVLEGIEKDKKMKDDERKRVTKNVRYMITGIHVDNKNVEKAAEILQELIKEEPDSATFHNDLGFIWADHDLKLEESEKLIRKALDLDKKAREKLLKEGKIDADTAKKENAAYLDSLGWVLYKNKKYDEAKKYLLESIKDDEEGAHMEIWDHLADVYLAQGNTKLAVETWAKALKFEDISKRDTERRKKITEKLRKAKASLKSDEK